MVGGWPSFEGGFVDKDEIVEVTGSAVEDWFGCEVLLVGKASPVFGVPIELEGSVLRGFSFLISASLLIRDIWKSSFS